MAASSAPSGPLGIDGPRLAQLLGLNEREVRDLATRGLVVKFGRGRYDLAASIKKYCGHLREMAAARVGRDGLDNVSENAMLTRERRRKLAQDAARDAGELIPVSVVLDVMKDHTRGVKAMILGFANEVQTECPHLDVETLLKIKAISEKVLRNNVEREIEVGGMHPEIRQFIDEKQGRKLI